MMRNILVTGGCGFIGSNFIHYMLQRYAYRIINLDCLTYAGNLENLQDIGNHLNYKFIYGKIENSSLIKEIMDKEKISIIIHFAAESHVDKSIMDSAPFIKTNIVGTHVLLDVARTSDIEKFIHISTDEVYGSLGLTGYFVEDSPLSSNSPYSASKAASDLLVHSFIHTYKFPAIIVRCSNNYGPYQFPEKFIPLSITNVLNEQPIPLYGDGSNVRDWIYVEDFCNAIDVILHRAKVGEIYNIGGQSEISNIEVLKSILALLDKPKSLIRYVDDRPGHDYRYAMDITKIKNELAWFPTHDFKKGLEKTIKWYKNNCGWWQRIKSGKYRQYYDQMYSKRLKHSVICQN